MVQIQCPDCTNVLTIGEGSLGKMATCPRCRAVLWMPIIASPTAITTALRASAPPADPAPASDGGIAEVDARKDDDGRRRRRRRARYQEEPPPSPVRRYFEEPANDASQSPTLGNELAALFGFGGLVIFFLFLSIAVDGAPFVTFCIGVGFGIIGSLLLMAVASEESIVQMLACLFIPFFSVYFVLTRFDAAKQAFFIHLTGVVLIIVGAAAGAFSDGDSDPPRVADHWRTAPRPDSFPARPAEDFPNPPPDNPFPGARPNNQVPEVPGPDAGPGRRQDDKEGTDQRGLRAHWSFDEGKGRKAIDSSLKRLEASLNGCKWVEGVKGTAVQFDGVQDYVLLSSDPVLDFAENSPFTVAGWFNTTKSEGHVLSFRSNPDRGDMVQVFLKRGELIAWVRHHGGVFAPDPAKTSFSVDDGRWHHFAVTRDRFGEVVLHVDAKHKALRERGKWGPQPKKIVTNLRALGLNALTLQPGSFVENRASFAGCIDEIYVYGEVLSEEEIKKLAGR